MYRLLIIGAGGHGEVVADIITEMASAGTDIELVGFLDDGTANHDAPTPGAEVLGRVDEIGKIGHTCFTVAIGDNRTRRRIFSSLMKRGETPFSPIHPSSTISRTATIGAGVQICAGVVVNAGTVVNNNVILNTSSSIDHHNRIGAHTHVGPGARSGGDVLIGEGALIGMNATIMPKRAIGDFATVGAGAVVSTDTPARTTVVGIPARNVNAFDR